MKTMRILDQLSVNQQANEAMAKRALGEMWLVASDIVRMFEFLASEFVPSEPGHQGVLRALLFAYRASSMAMLDVARLQFVEASGHERRMLEWIALCDHFRERPDDFQLWQEALSVELDPRRYPRWKEYRTRFGPEAVRSRLHALSPVLADAYRRCNLMVHGSVASQVRAVEVRDEGHPEKVQLMVGFSDIGQGSALPLAGEAIQVLNSALVGERTLALRLLDVAGTARWESALAPIASTLAVELDRWRRAQSRADGTG